MRAIWSTILSTGRSELYFGAPGEERALIVRRVSTARSVRLSVDPRNGAIMLSLPTRHNLRTALKWVETQRAWIDCAVARLPPARPLIPGATLPFEGRELLIDWREGLSRTVRHEEGRLIFGGPRDAVASRVLGWARKRALEVMTHETAEIAAQAGVTIGRVSVADTRSRWGSCSTNGDIRYCWRLIMAPAFVRRSTVAHEVAHRVHMNHSAAFHALAAKLYGGDPQEARAWLKANGSALHWVGRAES